MIKKKKTSEELPSYFVVDGVNVVNSDEIADQFNTFFFVM